MARLRGQEQGDEDGGFQGGLDREAALNGHGFDPAGGLDVGGGPSNDVESRVGTTPREWGQASAPGSTPAPDVARRALGGGGGGGAADNGEHAAATPVRPRSPQPMAGSVSQVQSGGAQPTGVMPFTPMGSPDVGSMATPQSNGLFGSLGGLKGGGLGLPLDPMSNQLSDPISMLLKRVMGGGQ